MNASLRKGQLAWIGLFGGVALMLSACGESGEQPPADQQGSLEPTQQESTAAVEPTEGATQQQ